MKKKGTTYLFVCLANMNRSPAAAMVMEGLARNLPIEAVSAGVSPMARRPVSRDLVHRADLIFVMEDYMKQSILRDYDVPGGKIIVLDIPDIYEQDDPVLVAQLRERLKPYV